MLLSKYITTEIITILLPVMLNNVFYHILVVRCLRCNGSTLGISQFWAMFFHPKNYALLLQAPLSCCVFHNVFVYGNMKIYVGREDGIVLCMRYTVWLWMTHFFIYIMCLWYTHIIRQIISYTSWINNLYLM